MQPWQLNFCILQIRIDDAREFVKTGKVEIVNGRNPRLKDMADALANFFCNPLLCKDDYADLFLMYLGKFAIFSKICPNIILNLL